MAEFQISIAATMIGSNKELKKKKQHPRFHFVMY
jgi:hypothetical protein